MLRTARLFSALLLFASLVSHLDAQNTAFVYRGQLSDGATPANGYYELQFRLTDAATGGNYLGSTLSLPPVAVSNGAFTVALDFGAAVFDGSARWLEMGVRTNGATSYTVLAPLQQIVATPYAIYAGNAASVSGSVSASQVTGVLSGVQLPGSVVTNGSSGVTLNGTFTGTMIGNMAGVTNMVVPDNALSSGLLFAAYGGVSNATFVRDLAAAMPVPEVEFSTWAASGGGNFLLYNNEEWAIGTAQFLYTNGYTAFFRPNIHLDEGWEAYGRDANGNITWVASAFPHGLPWLAQVLATNNCDLSLYLPVGGGCMGRQGTDLAHEFQDITNVLSWGVRGIMQDFCTGAYLAAKSFPTKEDFIKLEITIANNAISAASSADNSPLNVPSPYKTFYLETILFDAIENKNICPLEAKMMVNVAAMGGVDPNGTLSKDIQNLRIAQHNSWMQGPGTTLDIGSEYDEMTPTDFAIAAEGPFWITVGYIKGSSARSASTWTNNLAWLTAWQDPAMLPCKLVSSNNLFEVYNRPMGGLYTQDKLLFLSNLRDTPAPYTVTAASLGLSPGLVYNAQDIWNGTNVLFSGSFTTTVGASNFVQFRISLPTNGFTGVINAGGTLLGVTNGLIMSHTP